ncbi:MAG: hypothetical protein KBG48_13940 [Kofleriaceae bacterium]|jgi:hypothetical protein|nr:hypothetical protein [Kofleriaceae bacterium]MBP9168491.1 hypothetical protein [Kofleriaceae bacterium]MBP9863501.1 hypothetical protein [Kofleriaceae bacterium]
MSTTTTRAFLAVALAGAAACVEAPSDLTPSDHGPPEAARAEAQVEDAELADALGGVDLGEILAEIMKTSGAPSPVAQYCAIGNEVDPPPPTVPPADDPVVKPTEPTSVTPTEDPVTPAEDPEK